MADSLTRSSSGLPDGRGPSIETGFEPTAAESEERIVTDDGSDPPQAAIQAPVDDAAPSAMARISTIRAEIPTMPLTRASALDLVNETERLWQSAYDTIAAELDAYNNRLDLIQPGYSLVRVANRIADLQRLRADLTVIHNNLRDRFRVSIPLTPIDPFQPSVNEDDPAPRQPGNNVGSEATVSLSDAEHPLRRMDSDLLLTPIELQLPPPSIDAQRQRLRAESHEIYTLLADLQRSIHEPSSAPGAAARPEDVAEYSNIYLQSINLEQRREDLENLIRDMTRARTFLDGLPVLPLGQLSDDQRDCSICQETYGIGCASEVVRLPCNHLFGRGCIATWLTGGASTCPMCRRVLFYTPQHHALDGYEEEEVIVEERRDDEEDDAEAEVGEEPSPESTNLEQWHGRSDLLDYMTEYIDTLNHLLTRLTHQHSPQPISFLDTRVGPIDIRDVRLAGPVYPGALSFAELVWKMFNLFRSRPASVAREQEAAVAAALAGVMGRLAEGFADRIGEVVRPGRGPAPGWEVDPAMVERVGEDLLWFRVLS